MKYYSFKISNDLNFQAAQVVVEEEDEDDTARMRYKPRARASEIGRKLIFVLCIFLNCRCVVYVVTVKSAHRMKSYFVMAAT